MLGKAQGHLLVRKFVHCLVLLLSTQLTSELNFRWRMSKENSEGCHFLPVKKTAARNSAKMKTLTLQCTSIATQDVTKQKILQTHCCLLACIYFFNIYITYKKPQKNPNKTPQTLQLLTAWGMTPSYMQTILFWQESDGLSNANQSSLPRQKHSTTKQIYTCSHHAPGRAGKSINHTRPIDVSYISRRYQIIRARSTPRCYWMLSDAYWRPSHVPFCFQHKPQSPR